MSRTTPRKPKPPHPDATHLATVELWAVPAGGSELAFLPRVEFRHGHRWMTALSLRDLGSELLKKYPAPDHELRVAKQIGERPSRPGGTP